MEQPQQAKQNDAGDAAKPEATSTTTPPADPNTAATEVKAEPSKDTPTVQEATVNAGVEPNAASTEVKVEPPKDPPAAQEVKANAEANPHTAATEVKAEAPKDPPAVQEPKANAEANPHTAATEVKAEAPKDPPAVQEPKANAEANPNTAATEVKAEASKDPHPPPQGGVATNADVAVNALDAPAPVSSPTSAPAPETEANKEAHSITIEPQAAGDAPEGSKQTNETQAAKEDESHKQLPVMVIDVDKIQADSARSTSNQATSPRVDAQLEGYVPDCGTKVYKYLSYTKVMRNRYLTHPMLCTARDVDKEGNQVQEFSYYPLDTDFGAHNFQRLPTDSIVLSQYGIGLSLYFKFLKVMSWLFLILVVLSLPSLVLFIVGGPGNVHEEAKMLAKQNLPSVMGITTIGHLKQSSYSCDQVADGKRLELTCPAGEIGFIKAVYSDRTNQGTCTCPEDNKANAANKCQGMSTRQNDPVTGKTVVNCPATGKPCFLGKHPLTDLACCSYSTMSTSTIEADMSPFRIRSMEKCRSNTIQTIVEGLCMGKKSCAINVSENTQYMWKLKSPDVDLCAAGSVKKGKTCVANITDSADFSGCSDRSKRGLIVYAQCFTTQLDVSNEWSMRIVGWNTITREDFLRIAVACDIACNVIFLLVLLWLRKKEKQAAVNFTKDQIVVANYTVQLMALPRHNDLAKLRKDIKDHLETVLTNSPKYTEEVDQIRVADIQFGQSNIHHLEIIRRRGQIVRKLDIELQRLEKLKKLQGRLDEKTFDKRLQRRLKATKKLDLKLRTQNSKLDNWKDKQQNTSAQAVTAFVTFEEEEGYNRCLQEYPDLGFLYRLFQPKRKRLHGKRLRFLPAPDPTDICWTHLRHSTLDRYLRRAVVILITLIVLFASFLLIYFAKAQKAQLDTQRPSSCPDTVTNEEVVADEIAKANNEPYKVLVECYCKNLLVTGSFGEMMKEAFYNTQDHTEHQYCRNWATDFAAAQASSIAAILMVVVINAVLANVLDTLVKMEKHHTESAAVTSKVNKVFLSQFFNTVILMVLINANLSYFITGKPIQYSRFTILNGKYNDFTVDWYGDVGVALILTLIINAFVLHFTVLVTYLWLEWRRFWDRGLSFDFSLTKQDTQRDLEALYRGPKFDLADRYSATLTAIFATYMFSAGMPLLNLVGLISILLTYWADKFTFLRIVRSPPLYDGKIAEAAGYMLPYAMVLHCLMALWMYSNELVFLNTPDIKTFFNNTAIHPLVGEDIPSFNMETGRLLKRVTRPQVIFVFLFCVGLAAWNIVQVLLFDYFPSLVQKFLPCLKTCSRKKKSAKGLPNYFDAIPTLVLQEKVKSELIRPALREQYRKALERRRESSDLNAPRKASTRHQSNVSEEGFLVGCHSYAMFDNKEYVEELAIDSSLSETLDLESIF